MFADLNLPGALGVKVSSLLEWLKSRGSVIVMMSGGVDSGVLAYLSSLVLPDSTYGVTVKSASMISESVSEASSMAKCFNIFHRVLEIDVLSVNGVTGNPKDRCYLCKKAIIKKVREFAAKIGVETVLDGSNMDDFQGYRPGRRALEEGGVVSPFILFKLGKKDIRIIADKAGLYFRDKPSESCLFTRFPYNTEIKLADLKRVEAAERIVKDILGVSLVRVRDYGFWCRLELNSKEFAFVLDKHIRERLVECIKKLGYKYVTLDLEGYRSGSMDL